MNILHVTPFFKPSWEAGGPPRSVYEIARRQVKNGHNVTVYTTDGFKKRLDVKKNQPVNVDGIKTYYFRNLSMYMAGNLNFPLPYHMPGVVRKNISSFDIIHIHEHRTFLAAVVYHYAQKFKIPYIIQPRGSAHKLNKSRQKQIFDKVVGNDLIYDSCKIIATSKMESNEYAQYFPDLDLKKVVHVPNGVDIKVFSKLPSKGGFRKKYKISDDTKIILYLSRLYVTKGIDILIKAYAQLIDEFPDSKLVIAGPDDHYERNVLQLVNELNLQDNVLIPGPLYGEDKLNAYVDSDVFVLPSKSESFGNVVVEAMACKNPVVVTNTCGIAEWLDEHSSIIINYNQNELMNSLLYLLKNDSERELMGYNAEKRAINTFNWDHVVDELNNIYKSCL